MSILNNSVIIGLITAALYFIGYIEDSIFLRTLNFPVEQFVKKPEDLIHDGFMVVIGQSLPIIVISMLALVAIYALLFILSKKNEFFSKARIQFREFAKKYGGMALLVFTIVLFNNAVGDAVSNGLEKADSLVTTSMPNTHEVYFSDSSRKPIKGKLVRISPDLYGFLDYENGAALLIKHETVDVVIANIALLKIRSNKANSAEAKSRTAD